MRVNKSQLAKYLGVTKPRITHYTEKGMPFDAEGRIELETALAWIEANLDPVKRAMRGRAPTPRRPREQDGGAAIQQARAGYLAGVEAAIATLPVVVVIFAAARLGLSRVQATDLAEHTMLGMWEQLDTFGRENGLLADAGELAINPTTALAWRERVNWAVVFDAEGNGIVDLGDESGASPPG